MFYITGAIKRVLVHPLVQVCLFDVDQVELVVRLADIFLAIAEHTMKGVEVPSSQ